YPTPGYSVGVLLLLLLFLLPSARILHAVQSLHLEIPPPDTAVRRPGSLLAAPAEHAHQRVDSHPAGDEHYPAQGGEQGGRQGGREDEAAADADADGLAEEVGAGQEEVGGGGVLRRVLDRELDVTPAA